jgi:AraC-like DNA-binding protein
MKQNYVLLTLLLPAQIVIGQKNVFKITDSDQNASCVYFEDRSYSQTKVSKTFFYPHIDLKKAENEESWKEMLNAYQNASIQSPNNARLLYADRIIYAAKKLKDSALTGSAYFSKDFILDSLKKESNTIDDYIIANNYLTKSNNECLIYTVTYSIGQAKYYFGINDDTISLIKECVAYYKDENPRAYLNSLYSMRLCYDKLGNYRLLKETNKIDLSDSNGLNKIQMKRYLIDPDGINVCLLKNYDELIKKTESSLVELRQKEEYSNKADANFHIRNQYLKLKNMVKAIPYFKKVDRTFYDNGQIGKDLPEVYKLLIAYYIKIDLLKAQLFDSDQLLVTVKSLKYPNKHLIGKVHKECDTKAIVREKDKIRAGLEGQTYNDTFFVIATILFFMLLLFGTYHHFKNLSIYKKKFDELMAQKNKENENKLKPQLKNDKPEALDINIDTVLTLLKKLDKFERDKKFLQKEITLVKLAAAFNSNTKYLSKVITHYKNKGFVDYINDLKIDYLLTMLQEDKKIRNYTNKALAEEAGFSSTQRFASAFLTKTGMSTSFFIDLLKEGKT